MSLRQIIHEVTKIPIAALSGSDLSKFDIAERFSWAQRRETTKEEDGAYCLLGIFGCHLPLIYGEGRDRSMKRLKKEMMEASLDTLDASVNTKSRSPSQEERLSEICDWLSAPDPSINYHKAHRQRQADTGLWLLESVKFKDWKDGTASRLWLHGIPGCGKTVLSSTAIEHLQQYCNEDSQKITVYFYFDFNDTRKRSPEAMLFSLFCQLLQRLATIPDSVNALFSSSGKGHRRPSTHELVKIVPHVLQQFTHVYVVLDALDECTQRLELMEMLETVVGYQLDNVHLLMTSRRERDIEMSLESYIQEENSVCLQKDVVDEDILRYVQQRLREDKGLAKWSKEVAIREEIETALMRGARGMFRWAVCQLDMLKQCRNLTMLRRSLATLPKTLDQTYDRILMAISEQDRIYAMRILQWLTFSARPLRVEEVAEVVAIDIAREPVFDQDEVLVDPLEAMDICSTLVTTTTVQTLNGWERIITLAHYSVQEYLLSDRINQGPAKQYSMQEAQCHKAITKASLGYLNRFQTPITEEIFESSVLARYSAEFWIHHFQRTGDEEEELSRLAVRLLSIENPAYFSWLQLYDPDNPWRGTDFPAQLYNILTPLYYGALFGLNMITSILLDQGGNVNAQGGEYGDALQAASANGHEEVVKLLINAGASVNAQGGLCGNALQAASAGGHKRVARTLLTAGAVVNTQGGAYINAVHHALLHANETMIGILLERGANAGPDEQLRDAMNHAVNSARCTPSLVRILQRYNAPLDTVDVNRMTPLHYCVKFGHEAIAKQLLDAGVPIDIRVRRQVWQLCPSNLFDNAHAMLSSPESIEIGLTPLHFAALVGNPTMTKFLLGHGADPNAVTEYGQTPIHLTLCTKLLGPDYQDDWVDLKLRVEHLSITHVFNKNSVNADISRIALAREEILDALLENPNTSIAAKDHKDESFLHCIKYGKPESTTLVKRLVSRGADPLCCNWAQQSPLHLASEAGDCMSARMLIDMGAKVALPDANGLNSLHYAARSGDLDTIMAILETEDAKEVRLITSKDKCGQNVLHHALSREYKRQTETITWLLDQGADGSELDESGNSPLAAYTREPTGYINIEILKLLLEIPQNASFIDHDGQTLGHLCAANFYFDDCYGKTVLHCAAMAGSLDELSLEFLVNVMGIEPDDEDAYGLTASQYAVEAGAEHPMREDWGHERWERTIDVLLQHQSQETDRQMLAYAIALSTIEDPPANETLDQKLVM
ncbi:unnamed protein product [Alternaria alternata]